MIGVYKITSPSGKIYIGESKDIEARWYRYKILDCKQQIRLYNSLKKYGFENHKFEILTLCFDEQRRLIEREYQDVFNVIGKNGLNCKLTGTDELPGKQSEETKLKISISGKGLKRSDETRNKIRISKLGRKLTPEQLVAASQCRFGKSNCKSRRVICTETGETWDTIANCARSLQMSRQLLSDYLIGKYTNRTTIKYLDYE